MCQAVRFTSMPLARTFTGASSSAYASDSLYSDDSSDDDCQVLGSRSPPRHQEPVSPAASKSRNSSGPPWGFRSCGNKRPKQEPTRRDENYAEEDSDCLGPENVDDKQQNLRKQWEAAKLKRRACPPMRSEGSKAGMYGWCSQAPQSANSSSANLGGDSGTAETVQSNGHVSPLFQESPRRGVSFHDLSESTSISSDSVVEVETRDYGDDGNNAEPDEVVSGSRKRPAPAHASDQRPPESSGTSLKNGFTRPSCSMDVRKSVRRHYQPEEGCDASWSHLKFRTHGTDGASTSGHVAVDSLNIGNQCTGDSGVLEAALDVEQDLLGGREKLKETAGFKLAEEEEWARRQQELEKQAQEARRLKERKRAEADRKNEVELRQKHRLEEIRQTQQKEERNMGLKNQIRSKVQAQLERLASGCRDMATLLRLLQIPVEGGTYPSSQQVNAAYKKALLRFHPDRTPASVQGDPQRQVEAEETFKLITRMKQLLQPSMIAMAAR